MSLGTEPIFPKIHPQLNPQMKGGKKTRRVLALTHGCFPLFHYQVSTNKNVHAHRETVEWWCRGYVPGLTGAPLGGVPGEAGDGRSQVPAWELHQVAAEGAEQGTGRRSTMDGREWEQGSNRATLWLCSEDGE